MLPWLIHFSQPVIHFSIRTGMTIHFPDTLISIIHRIRCLSNLNVTKTKWIKILLLNIWIALLNIFKELFDFFRCRFSSQELLQILHSFVNYLLINISTILMTLIHQYLKLVFLLCTNSLLVGFLSDGFWVGLKYFWILCNDRSVVQFCVLSFIGLALVFNLLRILFPSFCVWIILQVAPVL